MKKLRRRAIVLFSVSFVLLSLVISFLFGNTYREQEINQHQNGLTKQLQTLTSQMNGKYASDEVVNVFIPYVIDASETISERITLINTEGVIIYDSHYDEAVGSNVSNQTEITEVMSEDIGSDVREADNSESQVLYIATPLFSDSQEVLGYLRLSRPFDEIASDTSYIYIYIIVLCLAAITIAIIFFNYWTRSISAPMEEMKDVVQELSNNNYSARYRELNKVNYKEVDEMGQAINKLAGSLETQLDELQQGNERLNSLIQNLSVGVMLLDSDRNIQLVNPMMLEILEENIQTGKSYIQYIKNPWLVEIIEGAYDKEDIQVTELTIQNGEERLLDATTIPINTNKDINIIILLYDITEITRLEKVRTDFVTNASHELKTPVTALKGFTETLLEGAMDDRETLESFLKIILKETERLDYLVGDILQLSKLEDKEMDLNLSTFDITEPVEEVRDILKQKADAKSIDVVINEVKPTIIESDFNLIKQILLNLMNNAILYTADDGRVTVSIDHTSDEAIIRVKDNGMGIPNNEQDRIFERFYRVDKARSRNAGGTGLGLSIVKHIIDNLNGSIQLDSQIGLGSEFTVYLPYTTEKNKM